MSGQEDASGGAVVRWIRSGEVEVYKAFRLRALADSPEAFGDSYAAAIARPESFWTDRVAQTSAGVSSVLFVAADVETDTWLGMTGVYIEPGAPETAEVVSVWVAPEARRRGLARRLIDVVTPWSRERGARRQRLWVTETNTRAQALYLGAGFFVTGTKRPLPSNPTFDELEMVRVP